MHSKNNNKTRTYIQGLKPFSSSIPKTLKKYLRKGGYNYSNIIDNWTRIVSKKISDYCYPNSVKMGKEMREGTIVLNVIHGKEMEMFIYPNANHGMYNNNFRTQENPADGWKNRYHLYKKMTDFFIEHLVPETF